ncbi:MAG TPA: glycosyltransferase, partial [Pyrinomonadaceae bacterium]|nr:glycosyltransferase [Pyrinomonadaceae bacterium]
EFYHVMLALIETHGWKHIDTMELWNAPGTLEDRLLRKFGELPETILFWEGYFFFDRYIREIRRLDAYRCIFADDIHRRDQGTRMSMQMAYLTCDTVFATSANVFDEHYPGVRNVTHVVWTPHAASPDFHIKFNRKAENAILLSGAVNKHYPLRQQLKALFDRGAYPIAYRPHPGYHCGYDYKRDESVGREYARTINRYRVGFTDCLKYKYLVAKYFEIPATGALLLAESKVGGAFERLGFVEDEHYISVSPDDLEEKIRFVLDEGNHKQLDRIRRRAQKLVRERHQTSDRARLIDEVCRRQP